MKVRRSAFSLPWGSSGVRENEESSLRSGSIRNSPEAGGKVESVRDVRAEGAFLSGSGNAASAVGSSGPARSLKADMSLSTSFFERAARNSLQRGGKKGARICATALPMVPFSCCRELWSASAALRSSSGSGRRSSNRSPEPLMTVRFSIIRRR